jgi:hypothetical protein
MSVRIESRSGQIDTERCVEMPEVVMILYCGCTTPERNETPCPRNQQFVTPIDA